MKREACACQAARRAVTPWITASLLISLVWTPCQAGGPLYMTGAGTPVRWDVSKPVRYVIDAGPLGTRAHADAAQAIQQAFLLWQGVDTAKLQVESAGELTTDIDGSNVMAFLSGLKSGDPSPILLDSDGSILDAIVGSGASDAIGGLGLPYLRNAQSGQIEASLAIFNGRMLSKYSDGYFHWAVSHELGHFLGLGHSQVNVTEIYDGDPRNDSLAPTMCLRGPNGTPGLDVDDEAWFSWLYPSADFTKSTGTIRGRVLLPDGLQTGFQGAHVIARRIGDPLVTAVGGVSGFRFRNPLAGGGARDIALLGEFILPGLPPGAYTLEVQELDVSPGVSVPAAYLVGGAKFWHEGSSAQDAPTVSTPILVNAGQEVTGIDVVLNGQSLGQPTSVVSSKPQPWSNPLEVALPAVVTGSVPDSADAAGSTAGTAGPPIKQVSDLETVYAVDLPEWTIVTAILTAAQKDADLDLYVLQQMGTSHTVEGSSTDSGTPPEAVQLRLPPGRHYFGVHRSGSKGSDYTLNLLGTPAPEPGKKPERAQISMVVIGDVTPASAVARWQTTAEAPSVLYYGQPLREIGSPDRLSSHAFTLSGLAPGSTVPLTIFAQAGTRFLEHDEVPAKLITASSAAANGMPSIAAVVSMTVLPDPTQATVLVQLSNRGDGAARDVRIEQLLPAAGWEWLTDPLSASAEPGGIQIGAIGAGGTGLCVLRLVRRGATGDPQVTVHGSYTDATGARSSF